MIVSWSSFSQHTPLLVFLSFTTKLFFFLKLLFVKFLTGDEHPQYNKMCIRTVIESKVLEVWNNFLHYIYYIFSCTYNHLITIAHRLCVVRYVRASFSSYHILNVVEYILLKTKDYIGWNEKNLSMAINRQCHEDNNVKLFVVCNNSIFIREKKRDGKKRKEWITACESFQEIFQDLFLLLLFQNLYWCTALYWLVLIKFL